MPPKNMRRKGHRRRWTHCKQKTSANPELTATATARRDDTGSTCESSTISLILAEAEENITGDLSGTDSAEPVTTNVTLTGEVDLLNVPCQIKVPDNFADDAQTVPLDHDYVKVPCDLKEPASDKECSASAENESVTYLLQQVCQLLAPRLPRFWVPFVEDEEIYVVLFSRRKPKALQRSLCCSSNGTVELTVHSHTIPKEFYMTGISQVELVSSTVGEYCDRLLEVIQKVRVLEVCAGLDNSEYRHVWNAFSHIGEIDKNPFQECRYSTTFRSVACLRLVDSRKWKCTECAKLTGFLRRRHVQAMKEEQQPHVRNDLLTEEQRIWKIQKQQEKIGSQQRRLDLLEQRMQSLLATDGVHVGQDLHNDLQEVLRCEKLSPVQSMFLQQQTKASQVNNKRGMRWHPSMIRLALAIFVNSRSTYELIRDTGAIKLPSSRTLFDYSHPDVVKEGICASTVRDVSNKVLQFKENYKKYHVLMADEMFTSKNLVFHKASGELRGFMKLNDLDKEVKLLENYLDDDKKKFEPEISTKILSFLVKGVCTDIKTVVATFAVSTVSVMQLYKWTWDVLRTLERCGVWVAAFTCDGSPTNRAFIKMHPQVKKNDFIYKDEQIPGDATYVTNNKAAPHRNLYFICDVPHLLKTIRNAFNNSRIDRMKGKRRLKINGQYIVWDTIINLYNLKKGKMLRKSYKLNAQNVFPDAYSCMKVSLAAQVLSMTVATDIEHQNWPGTSETVRFIRFVNDWFDCLNGAHTYHGKRKNNPRLYPYTDPNDTRFQFLISFVQYLDDWKSQAERQTTNLDESIVSNASTLQDFVSDNDPHPLMLEDVHENDDTPAGKAQLSHQTLLGIEVTVKSFISCTRFLLNEGCPFINPRVFCQDPLEQHFSKLRSGFGGSTNPTANQCLIKQNSIHIMGQLGVKRKGNTVADGTEFQVTEEILRKRKSVYSLSHES